ncbi:VOC family protein [Allorhizocola rhizosphaerae]|uniref:VOC family protein n=1 Tax=Allorhizocola rhizosphaerae TaxID=1872709 RepID=UPI0013C31D44|nr:VOC family protein [Allorhizocola rhizosphaerae]
MGLRWHGTAVNAMDPARLGRWWAEVLRVGVLYERPDVVVLPGLTFVRVDDDVVPGRSRVHLELDSDDIAADVEKLLDMGARHVSSTSVEAVLADPEGNEFRVRPPR